eukprot:409522_1
MNMTDKLDPEQCMIRWNTMHKHLNPGPRYFTHDCANELFARTHAKYQNTEKYESKGISSAFDEAIMPQRNENDRMVDESILFGEEHKIDQNGYHNNNNNH